MWLYKLIQFNSVQFISPKHICGPMNSHDDTLTFSTSYLPPKQTKYPFKKSLLDKVEGGGKPLPSTLVRWGFRPPCPPPLWQKPWFLCCEVVTDRFPSRFGEICSSSLNNFYNCMFKWLLKVKTFETFLKDACISFYSPFRCRIYERLDPGGSRK